MMTSLYSDITIQRGLRSNLYLGGKRRIVWANTDSGGLYTAIVSLTFSIFDGHLYVSHALQFAGNDDLQRPFRHAARTRRRATAAAAAGVGRILAVAFLHFERAAVPEARPGCGNYRNSYDISRKNGQWKRINSRKNRHFRKNDFFLKTSTEFTITL